MGKENIKKIGSIPLGYDENDIVFMEGNKIFIKKSEPKKKVVPKKKESKN